MGITNIQQEALLRISLDEIEIYYLCMNFSLQKLNACDIDEAKVYINQIIFHGKASDTSMAQYYANIYAEYDEYTYQGDKFELYPYINHLAVKKEFEDYKKVNLRNFIDYESLGRDMINKDVLYNAYYRFNGNVFEVIVESIGEYIDVDVAEYCYLSVQKLINTGLSIDDAINATYTNIHVEVA